MGTAEQISPNLINCNFYIKQNNFSILLIEVKFHIIDNINIKISLPGKPEARTCFVTLRIMTFSAQSLLTNPQNVPHRTRHTKTYKSLIKEYNLDL